MCILHVSCTTRCIVEFSYENYVANLWYNGTKDVLGKGCVRRNKSKNCLSNANYLLLINKKLQFSNYYALGFDQGDFINSISSISSGTRRSFYQNLKRQAYFGGRNTSIQLGGKNKNSNQSVQVLEYRNKSIRSVGVFNGDSLQVTLP